MWDSYSKEALFGLGIVVCSGVCFKLARRSNLLASFLSSSNSSVDLSHNFNLKQNMKMLLVVRNDLNMGKGKIAAQCAHAALEGYLRAIKTHPEIVRRWKRSGQMKIVVKVNNEAELLQLDSTCKSMGISSAIIQDAGHTQVEPGTRTVLCIGPGPEDAINKVAGHLKLM